MSFEEQYPADECAGCREYEQERIRLTARLAEAEEAARWLLYDAPGKPYAEVSEFVNNRPWLRLEREHGNSTRVDRSAS